MNLRFYRCEICGKIVAVLSDTEIPTFCCGRAMQELIPNTTDGAAEKHVPVLYRAGDTVSVEVGSAPHPMTVNHSITQIGLRTSDGFLFRELRPEDRPEACFTLQPGEHAEAAYAFCNLHGLWRADGSF